MTNCLTRCISSMACPSLSLAEFLALARRHDIPCVEIRTVSGSLDVPAALASEFGSPGTLADFAAESSVRIVSLNTSPLLGTFSEKDRAAFQEFIPWAEELGGIHLRVIDGGAGGEDAFLKQSKVFFDWWRKEKAARNLRSEVIVETHDSLLDADRIERFVRHCDHPHILWDSFHTFYKSGEDPMCTWSRIKPFVRHIHLKDFVRSSHRSGKTYVPLGQGLFPLDPLLQTLRAEFDGPVCLEWERLWFPELVDMETCLTVSREHSAW